MYSWLCLTIVLKQEFSGWIIGEDACIRLSLMCFLTFFFQFIRGLKFKLCTTLSFMCQSTMSLRNFSSPTSSSFFVTPRVSYQSISIPKQLVNCSACCAISTCLCSVTVIEVQMSMIYNGNVDQCYMHESKLNSRCSPNICWTIEPDPQFGNHWCKESCRLKQSRLKHMCCVNLM